MKKLGEILCWYYLEKSMSKEEYEELRKLDKELKERHG